MCGLCFFIIREEGRCRDTKKGNLPRLPIFINLKSNTMKNTLQMYNFHVIQHIKTKENFFYLTFFEL